MTRGKIVLIPFPFDDLTTQKARPAVCLTEPMTSHRHVVLAFVTSRPPDEQLDTDVVVDPVDPGFAQTGLQVRSTIRVHRLLTVASGMIKRELGTLSSELQARIDASVSIIQSRTRCRRGRKGHKLMTAYCIPLVWRRL